MVWHSSNFLWHFWSSNLLNNKLLQRSISLLFVPWSLTLLASFLWCVQKRKELAFTSCVFSSYLRFHRACCVPWWTYFLQENLVPGSRLGITGFRNGIPEKRRRRPDWNMFPCSWRRRWCLSRIITCFREGTYSLSLVQDEIDPKVFCDFRRILVLILDEGWWALCKSFDDLLW